jgi:hypothetical protein
MIRSPSLLCVPRRYSPRVNRRPTIQAAAVGRLRSLHIPCAACRGIPSRLAFRVPTPTNGPGADPRYLSKSWKGQAAIRRDGCWSQPSQLAASPKDSGQGGRFCAIVNRGVGSSRVVMRAGSDPSQTVTSGMIPVLRPIRSNAAIAISRSSWVCVDMTLSRRR